MKNFLWACILALSTTSIIYGNEPVFMTSMDDKWFLIRPGAEPEKFSSLALFGYHQDKFYSVDRSSLEGQWDFIFPSGERKGLAIPKDLFPVTTLMRPYEGIFIYEDSAWILLMNSTGHPQLCSFDIISGKLLKRIELPKKMDSALLYRLSLDKLVVLSNAYLNLAVVDLSTGEIQSQISPNIFDAIRESYGSSSGGAVYGSIVVVKNKGLYFTVQKDVSREVSLYKISDADGKMQTSFNRSGRFVAHHLGNKNTKLLSLNNTISLVEWVEGSTNKLLIHLLNDDKPLELHLPESFNFCRLFPEPYVINRTGEFAIILDQSQPEVPKFISDPIKLNAQSPELTFLLSR